MLAGSGTPIIAVRGPRSYPIDMGHQPPKFVTPARDLSTLVRH
jgi:hypothetical protein